MAGGQQKNGFAPSIVLDGTQEIYRVKRIKSGASRCDLDIKSCISLKWDDSKKSVVAKTDQIGLSRRELIHFSHGIRCHDNVADVIAVPPEIFTVDNLDNVLTYEVWQNYLSESERSVLTQFLPKNCDPDQVVQQLLSGDNFHFGNPHVKWGALLCSGNLHPDNILTTERCFRANKKAYYSELQTYHTHMIDSLQRWKERAVDCKDLNEDIIQRMWRSRSNSKKRVFTPEPRVPELEENVFATPESSCRAASEIVCSSDNPNGISLHGEISMRKGSTTSKIDNPDGFKHVSKPEKEEKLLKHSIYQGDGARYMSYIKVSKSQHQRIKSSMKHSSSSIQAKSLYSVLGNIDSLHIQPFEVYEKEEWQKLHDHWLQLANRDLPPFVVNWRNLQLQRLQIKKSLSRELEERMKCQKESFDQDKEESLCYKPPEPLDNFDTNHPLTEMEELDVAPSMPAVEVPVSAFKETPLMMEEEAPSTGMTLDESPSMTEEEAPAMTKEESPTMTEEESPAMTNEESSNLTKEDEVHCNGLMEEQQDNIIGAVGLVTFEDKERENSIRDAGDFVSVPTQSDLMHQTTSLANGCPQYDDMNIETHGNLNLKKGESSLSSSKYSLDLGNVDVPVSREGSIASDVDTWPQVNMPGLFYHSTSLSHGYSSSNELALGHPQVQTSQLLHLEAFNLERMGERAALDAFNGESIGGRDALQLNSGPSPFFNPYNNQERNELYQLYKSETDLSYQHDHKQAGTSFQPEANVLVETDQCSARMKEQMHSSLPLELRQKGLSDIFLNQNIQESMYSNGVSYPIPRLETLPLNVRDWTTNAVQMSAPPPPPHSHVNGGLLNPNWYAGDNPARGSWSCIEGGVGPSQGIGSGSSSDQSLFRVLSECNELQAGAQYDPMSSSRRLMQSGNYGGVTDGVHTTSHMLPQTVNSLNYLNDLDPTAGYKTASSIGMMSMPHQTPGLEETIENKSFLRSWNQ